MSRYPQLWQLDGGLRSQLAIVLGHEGSPSLGIAAAAGYPRATALAYHHCRDASHRHQERRAPARASRCLSGRRAVAGRSGPAAPGAGSGRTDRAPGRGDESRISGRAVGLPSPARDWHEHVPAITLPRRSGNRSRGGLASYRTAALPSHHITCDPDGYDVTTVSRTAVDLARGEELPQALVVLDAAARLLVAEIVSQPRREHYANSRLLRAARESLDEAVFGHGAAALRRAIALTDPRRESPIESLSAGHFHVAGLPTPSSSTRFVPQTGGTTPTATGRPPGSSARPTAR